MTAFTAVSAPGKVLLAGGYLVLDRKHTASTFALDARIHVVMQQGVGSEIRVRSPQFKDAVWRYSWDSRMRIQDVGDTPNPFVKTALQYALAFVSIISKAEDLMLPWDLTILADNDYYSQPTETSSSSGSSSSPSCFHKFDVPITEVNKTGLGSSAALVTALVGAVLQHCSRQDTSSTTSFADQLHRVAQIAHCAAQGKVGSGFDIASAVFGSCIYRRFSPSIPERAGPVEEDAFPQRLYELVLDDSAWDYEINAHSRAALPKGLRLVMCDVDCGSQTPGMVKQVLKWRAEHRQTADTLWDALQSRNDELARRLSTFDSTKKDRHLEELRLCILDIRRMLRDMSTEADVPIEPEAQSRLLDACSAVPGVVGGVVPGAGGYDAITLLIEDDAATAAALEELFRSWEPPTGAGKVRLLRTQGENAGWRTEAADAYHGWIDTC